MRSLKLLLVLVCLALVTPTGTYAQVTPGTASISGTITDATGAVVPGAEVVLTDTATNITRNATTDAVGHYTFISVTPGVYKVTVSASGFKQAVVLSFKADVGRAHLLNVTVQVGAVSEVVEVSATAAVELQTTDASVGTVIAGEALMRMPIPGRSVASLLSLQPTATPTRGEGDLTGGQVAGARTDQHVFLLDGGDATNNTEGSGGYALGGSFGADVQPVIPVPAESIEEFRVTTTGSNATFGRSEGAQIQLTSKRGTNSIHGSAYWIHQNDDLNANSWSNNLSGIKRQESKQNRYGFSAGGPIHKDSTWIYGHYEAWRFPRKDQVFRRVPSATLRQGILQFRDASGVVRQYNLATSTACVAGGCDPRGRGISPVISRLFALYPAGNDPAAGDGGLNTLGFRAPIDTTLNTEFWMARLDHKLNDKWNLFSTYRYYKRIEPSINQVDIVGLTPPTGTPHSTKKFPVFPRYATLGINGLIRPNLTSETRLSFDRNFWAWQAQAPFPQVSGTNAALDVGGESVTGTISEPINVDTQQARSRNWRSHDWYVAENMAWVKGRHTIQFGGSLRDQRPQHQRDDKVTGGLASAPIYYLGTGEFSSVTSRFRPPACTAGQAGFCLRSGSASLWDLLYTNVLGMLDKGTQVTVRDGDFNAKPIGSSTVVNVLLQAAEFYTQDIWRIRPSVTFTYGLSWQLQMPPRERNGIQVVMVDAASQLPVRLDNYFRRQAEAALAGQIYNPTLAWMPIRHIATQKYVFPIDWNNFSPRVAAAWNPSFGNRFFGNRKTVIRGGYGITYTRMNGVGLVMIPVLASGALSIQACGGPVIGGTCARASDPTNAFRIGVDGSGVTIPPGTAVPIPFIVSQPFGETRNFGIDPAFKLGTAHSWDVTWQRELRGNMLLEVGYVGRAGRNLQQDQDINSVPFFMKDPVSGQTLGAAFDAVAEQLRAGVAPSAVTPQPWFENFVGAGGTRAVAASRIGAWSVSDMARVFTGSGGVDRRRLSAGLLPITNLQVTVNSITSDHGRTDYNAAFVSLHRRYSKGLQFDFNYTWSHAIDLGGLNQQYVQYGFFAPALRYTNLLPQYHNLDRQPAYFDRRHAANLTWFYELPFGSGRNWASAGVASKILGGWYSSGIFGAASGLPSCVYSGATYGARNTYACAMPLTKDFWANKRHLKVTGTNSVQAGGLVGGGGDSNIFADPGKVYDSFRWTLLSKDTRFMFGSVRGFPRWNLDLAFGKKTSITEKLRVVFGLDIINFFNHFEPADPGTDLNDPEGFGVVTDQYGSPRFMQFSFRFEF